MMGISKGFDWKIFQAKTGNGIDLWQEFSNDKCRGEA
jgi:hypothetical protein